MAASGGSKVVHYPILVSVRICERELCPGLNARGIIRLTMPLAAGTKLDGYEILGLLGAGGMGEVYRARDPALKREVAIKVLPSFVSQDPDRLRRFEQEAQAAAALNHPNILAVHQFGTFEGAPYLVSELLEGSTLRQLLQRGPLPVRKAIDYGVQIAHGLAAAHDKGIVHRDLKPENLFVAKDGQIKILDFGLAKLMQRQPDPDGIGPTQTKGTDPGMVMGTVGYMSPEQVRGKPADHHADIFAFGAILYEMLTDKRAFQRSTSAETMTAILNDDPPGISQIVQTAPPGLQRVVHRCLEKNPEQRFQSASDLAFALEALTDPSSATEHAGLGGGSQVFRWARWVVPSALVLAVVLIGLYLRRSSLVTGSGARPPSLDIRALTESGKASRVAATPDGRYVAYVNKDAGNFELRLLQVATQRDVRLLPGTPREIDNLHFSADGNFIYFLRRLDPDTDPRGVYRIGTLGGPVTLLATDAEMLGVTVSPDGKHIAYITETPNESQIISIDADGTNRRVTARRPMPQRFYSIEWSPLPDTLAAVAIGKTGIGLLRVDVAAGSIRDLSVSGWGLVGQPAWSPDGATIFAPAALTGQPTFQIWAFDASTGVHRPLTAGSTDYDPLTLSATGTGDLVAMTRSYATSIWATDQFAHLRPIPILRGEGSDSVAWVDGQIVTSNSVEMLVHDADGSNPTRLQSYSAIYSYLDRCGPHQVVYRAFDREHRSHIARTDIVSGSTTRLTDGPTDYEPACSVDGSTLVFIHTSWQDNRCSITRKSLDSGQSLTLYETDPCKIYSPILSPDGTKVLFYKEPDAKDASAWAVVPLTGGSPQTLKIPIPTVEPNPSWAPDGKSILYVDVTNRVGNIWSAPLDGKPPRKLTAFDADQIFAFDVSPDNRLAISRGSVVGDVVLIKNAR